MARSAKNARATRPIFLRPVGIFPAALCWSEGGGVVGTQLKFAVGTNKALGSLHVDKVTMLRRLVQVCGGISEYFGSGGATSEPTTSSVLPFPPPRPTALHPNYHPVVLDGTEDTECPLQPQPALPGCVWPPLSPSL